MHGTIPPLLQYGFMLWCSVKAEGQLYLYRWNQDLKLGKRKGKVAPVLN